MVGDQALAKSLTKVASSIERLRQRHSRVGEQDTKAVLIDPILAALGWELQNLDDVSREYRRKPQDNPVDYALFLLRSPCLFVEAKALDTDLSDRKWVSQTIAYAATVGVEWCILTNGDEYRLYNAHAPVDVEEKLFRSVSIASSPNDPYTIETLGLLSKDRIGENLLNTFWKAHFVDRQVKLVLEALVGSQDKSLLRLIRKRTDGLSAGQIERSLKRAEVIIDFPAFVRSSTAGPTKNIETKQSSEPQQKRLSSHRIALSDLIRADILEVPLDLEVNFKGHHLTAIVQPNGHIEFEGETYASLSIAGGIARNKINGPPSDGRPYYQTNGWTFWKYQDRQSGKLQDIDFLRKRYLEKQA